MAGHAKGGNMDPRVKEVVKLIRANPEMPNWWYANQMGVSEGTLVLWMRNSPYLSAVDVKSHYLDKDPPMPLEC